MVLLAWRGSDPLIFLPCGRIILPSGKVWDACAARGLKMAGYVSLILSALRAWDFSPDRRLRRLRGARALLAWRGSDPLIFLPFGRIILPSGKVWDACAARGKVGPVMGLRPLRGPPLHPPRSTPKESFQRPSGGEGTRLALRELPSLATLAQVISLRDA